jgi:hypothetical protein
MRIDLQQWVIWSSEKGWSVDLGTNLILNYGKKNCQDIAPFIRHSINQPDH